MQSKELKFPEIKKVIQSFLGKIDFMRRLIPSFVEIVKHIRCMLRKDVQIKWTHDAK